MFYLQSSFRKITFKFSRKLKNYMPKICQIFQKVELNSLKWSYALVLINNVNVGILEVSRNYSKILIRWQWKMWFRRCFKILQLEQATNNLRRHVKHEFYFLFTLLVDFTYIYKQADFKQVISGKSWRELRFEFKTEHRVVWTTSES